MERVCVCVRVYVREREKEREGERERVCSTKVLNEPKLAYYLTALSFYDILMQTLGFENFIDYYILIIIYCLIY